MAGSELRADRAVGRIGRRGPDHVVRHRGEPFGLKPVDILDRADDFGAHDLDRQRDLAPVGGNGHLIAVRHADFSRGHRRQPGHRGAGGSRQVRLPVLHPPAVKELVPGREPDPVHHSGAASRQGPDPA